MKKLKRKYRITDYSLLEKAKVIRTFFIDEQADFAAFDSDFAHPYEETWETVIDECQSHLNDETVRDQLQQRTANVKAAMRACHNKFMDTKYFIRKAFPDNPGMQKAFGFDTFLVTARRQLSLLEFMQVFHALVLEHAAALNAVGYSNTDIEEIKTLYEALEHANTEQERFKGGRPTLTMGRKISFNKLWEVMRMINSVSRIIHRDNPTMRNIFMLPVPLRKKKKKEKKKKEEAEVTEEIDKNEEGA
jgi:hypothetical protein